jgi:hypothetical protein
MMQRQHKDSRVSFLSTTGFDKFSRRLPRDEDVSEAGGAVGAILGVELATDAAAATRASRLTVREALAYL